MSAAQKSVLVGLALLNGALGAAGPLSLDWEGALSWDLATQAASLETGMTLGWEVGAWAWTATSTLSDGVWTELAFAGRGVLGELELAARTGFDPQAAAVLGTTLSGSVPVEGLRLEGVARLEPGGFGWGLTVQAPQGALLERLRLRFNLKRTLDEVAQDTFAAGFSYGEARFSLPAPCCVDRVRGWVRFTKSGFDEAGTSFSLPLFPDQGISLGSTVRFVTTGKRDSVTPMWVYEAPACVEVIAALDWDEGSSGLWGVKVYALGVRCEVGAITVRSLTVLGEGIGLIKSPYWELLSLQWTGAECCGPAEFGVTFYFGDTGLLGIGELEATFEAALSERLRVGLGLELPAAGGGTLRLSWRVEL